MTYGPNEHQRRSIRLPGYDYGQAGAYFVTVCAQNQQCVFGNVEAGMMHLNVLGEIVQETWRGLPGHYPYVELDAFLVMPNHVHMIVVLVDSVGAGLKPAPTTFPLTDACAIAQRHRLPEIIRAFKTFSSRRINEHRATPGVSLWQRNYFEHIIRNDVALDRIRQYILDNPVRWAYDCYNPQASHPDADDPWRE